MFRFEGRDKTCQQSFRRVDHCRRYIYVFVRVQVEEVFSEDFRSDDRGREVDFPEQSPGSLSPGPRHGSYPSFSGSQGKL